MPSLPFQPRLIQSVMSGDKPFTVRQLRQRHPIKAGDTLYIFTGMRTPKCKRHGSHQCVRVYDITVDAIKKSVTINGVELIPIIRHWFTTTDIQGSEQDFFDFFAKQKYERPLVLICWNHSVAKSLDEWLRDARMQSAIGLRILPSGQVINYNDIMVVQTVPEVKGVMKGGNHV